MNREVRRLIQSYAVALGVIAGIIGGLWWFIDLCDRRREATFRRQYPATSTVTCYGPSGNMIFKKEKVIAWDNKNSTDVIWVPEHMERLYKHAEFTGDATIKGTCVIERIQ